MSRSTVARWERGESRAPYPRLRPGLAEALGVTASELEALFDSAPGEGPGGRAEPHSLVTVTALHDDREAILVNLTRRELLRGLGAVAFASGAVPSDGTRGRWHSLVGERTPAEHFVEIRQVLVDADNLYGPSRVLPSVYEQLSLLDQLLGQAEGADRNTVAFLKAQFAEFAAWLNQDLGDHDRAWYWTDQALELSYLMADPRLTSFTLARKSQLAGDMKDGTRAVDYAQAAASHARGVGRLAAVAATFEAHGQALIGDSCSAHASYEQSRQLLRSAVDLEPAVWASWFNPSYIDAQQAASSLTLGNYDQAASRFETALTGLAAGYHRDRAVYLARAARANAGQGDLDLAIDRASIALTATNLIDSGRVEDELQQLAVSLEAVDTIRSVEFRDELRRSGLAPAGATA